VAYGTIDGTHQLTRHREPVRELREDGEHEHARAGSSSLVPDSPDVLPPASTTASTSREMAHRRGVKPSSRGRRCRLPRQTTRWSRPTSRSSSQDAGDQVQYEGELVRGDRQRCRRCRSRGARTCLRLHARQRRTSAPGSAVTARSGGGKNTDTIKPNGPGRHRAHPDVCASPFRLNGKR